MQLGTLKSGDAELVVARDGNGELIPLRQELLHPDSQEPDTGSAMRRLIAGWSNERAQAIQDYVESAQSEALDPGQVCWLPPLSDPGKICGVAMNNSASNARKITAPEHPAFFLKPPSSMVAHEQPIVVRSYYGSVHPEPELAVVIGQRLRDATPEEAIDHVFGYTIINDVTGNGMRAEDRFHYYALYPKEGDPDALERVEQHLSYAARYKGTDTFCAIGPFITTADSIADPDDLSVSCHVAGEKIADDSTRFYNFKVAEILSFLSYFMTLHPGDIVSLGTAFKPGATRKSIHHANFLSVGGPVSVEIEGLGRQENPVVVEQKPLGRWRLTGDSE